MEQILFEDISHKDFEFYAGSWQIQDVPEELLVLYRLTSKSRFSGPGFLEKRSVKKTVRGLLEEVREEILRRALEGARSSGGVRTEVRSQIGGLTSLPNVEGRGVEVPSLVLHASPRQGDQETWQLCVKRLVMKPPCCGACPSLTILEC
ncbi:MAG: hypothetical protein HYZ73_07580 [Elusimicrobia bacterium]|nr:hypothetical protein [Elusimicrobiota bacterium]